MSYFSHAERLKSFLFRWMLLLFGPVLISSRWAVVAASRRLLTPTSCIEAKEAERKAERDAVVSFLTALFEDDDSPRVLLRCDNDRVVWEALSSDELNQADNQGLPRLVHRIFLDPEFKVLHRHLALTALITRLGSPEAALFGPLPTPVRREVWRMLGPEKQFDTALQLLSRSSTDDVLKEAVGVITRTDLAHILRRRESEVRLAVVNCWEPFATPRRNETWRDLLGTLPSDLGRTRRAADR